MTDTRRIHIIIADDDGDDQSMIRLAINKSDYKNTEITSVYDGVQLIEYLEEALQGEPARKPDLILLDVNMPLMDGFTALKKLKANDKTRDIPVFVISTLRTMEGMEIFYELGAANVFSKPNSLVGYQQIIETVLAAMESENKNPVKHKQDHG